jgi:hypothetical protein
MTDAQPGTPAPAPPSPLEELVRPLAFMALLLAALLLFAGPHLWPAWLKLLVANLLAFGFGAAVGATELIARYRDDPAHALHSRPARLYMVVNGIVGWAAFWLIHSGRMPLPTELFKGHPLLNALVLGGFGGMALFRTSFFNVRIRDRDVPIGPAAVLQIILRAADRAVDRERAGPRADNVRRIMQGVSYERAKSALPSYCYMLMQNVSQEERTDLDQWIVSMEKSEIRDDAKAYYLGLQLMNLVGEVVLERAVTGLADRIKGPPRDEPPVLAEASDFSIDDVLPIREVCVALTPAAALKKLEPRSAEALMTFDAALTDAATRVLIAFARLRSDFGAETVSIALGAYRLRKKAREVTDLAGRFGPPDAAGTPSGATGAGTVVGDTQAATAGTHTIAADTAAADSLAGAASQAP